MTTPPTIDVAALSHELRSPLHTIMTLSELLQDQPDAPLELRRKLADHIGASARELLDVLNGLIALTRARAGRETLEISAIAPQDVAQSAVHALRGSHPSARVDADCPSSVPAIDSDAGLLRQLFIALGEHALRASGAAGSVTLAVAAPAAGEIVVSVAHTRSLQPTPRSAQARATLALELAEALAGLLGGALRVSDSDATQTLSVSLRALRAESASQ